jgi:hypothetical protein
MQQKNYSHEQLEIALIKKNNETLYKTLMIMKRTQYKTTAWIIGLNAIWFLSTLAVMAHGFKWVI